MKISPKQRSPNQEACYSIPRNAQHQLLSEGGNPLVKNRQRTLDNLLELERRALQTRIREQGSAEIIIYLSELDSLDEAIKLVFDQEGGKTNGN